MKKVLAVIYVTALFLGLAFAHPVLAGICVVPDPDLAAGAEKTGTIRSSELLNRVVRNPQGYELGLVNDLVVEEDGRIAYIVICEGESEAGQLIPVPFGSVFFGGYENWLVLSNMDRMKFEHAPSIRKDEWKRLDDPLFKNEVFSYYGQPQRQMERKLR